MPSHQVPGASGESLVTTSSPGEPGWLRKGQRLVVWSLGVVVWRLLVQTVGQVEACSANQNQGQDRAGEDGGSKTPSNPDSDAFTIQSLLVSYAESWQPNLQSGCSQACCQRCGRKWLGLHSRGCQGVSSKAVTCDLRSDPWKTGCNKDRGGVGFQAEGRATVWEQKQLWSNKMSEFKGRWRTKRNWRKNRLRRGAGRIMRPSAEEKRVGEDLFLCFLSFPRHQIWDRIKGGERTQDKGRDIQPLFFFQSQVLWQIMKYHVSFFFIISPINNEQ